MHSFYLREMYLNNSLAKPDVLEIQGTKIDITKISTPSCFVSAVEDHIAPWRSTFAGAKLLGGEKTFILTNGGHVAGIVNPVESSRYSHYVSKLEFKSPDEWLESAKNMKASWWITWSSWLADNSGSRIKALNINPKSVIEDAPGSYVRSNYED